MPIDWTGKRSGPVTITVQTGGWPPGVYAARLTTDDGRIGFAPVRPPRTSRPSRAGSSIVMPTNTWQAYNFYDRDGDGWGDTWYAGGSPPVDLTRPYRDRGVPPRFKTYDRAFLRWLARTGRTPDFAADDDLETFATGDDLRARYDLIVFPGHSEYMTAHAYDVIERYRDLGGRLIFLSANNFFWKVETDGSTMRRVKLWRDARAARRRACSASSTAPTTTARRQGPYTVVAAEAAPWLFDKTGLVTGSTFGETVGGYGIEIDMATPDSPPGHDRPRARRRSLRARAQRRDDVLRDRGGGARLLGGHARLRRLGDVLADQPAARRTSGLTCSPTSCRPRSSRAASLRRLVAAPAERRKANTANGITASVSPAATSRNTE